jgi:protein O-mannosyl-transferase
MLPPRNSTTIPAVLAVAVLLVYFNALGGAFQFDDYNVIVNNPAVHSLGAWADSMPGIRPVLKFSYALNWAIHPAAFGFHLFNVIVHGINVVLVFRLLVVLSGDEAKPAWAPLVGALLFALHPVQTEAVTYVSGRSVSLMALFYLCSLLAWLQAEGGKNPRAWQALSAALFAIALLVKETAVTLPLALLLLDVWRSRGSPRPMELAWRQRWHLLALAGAAVVFLASPVYRHLLDVSVSARGIGDNLLTQVNAIGYLAGQLVIPWRMNVDPDLPVLSGMTLPLFLQLTAIVAIIVAGFRNLRRHAWLAFAVLWFFLHLLPTNSLLPRLDVANDRQLYLAAIGLFYAAGLGVESLLGRFRRKWVVGAATAAALLVLGFATVQRNQVFATAVEFWEDALMKSPRKARVANNLGFAYQQAGRLAEAKLAYQQAIEIDPEYWRARINLDVLESAAPR